MYLKRLQLHGYKTFANPTEFEFNSGITAIVGPNGSGKSNIADAVQWVLGEQSFATLRAKKTEDMIFAGGKQRARLGMAEASLTFDNSDQWLPIEFSEVTITRRAYRSGENEYHLNGTRVRLRDILDILGKAGLGHSKYAVIGQGLVDAALSLRPTERRALIEEAAGVGIYLIKRQATLNRLTETKQNMLRVSDIIHEITPRVRRLEKQAKRAEEHALLNKDLREILSIWYGYQWQHTAQKMKESQTRLERQEQLLAAQRARLRELATKLQKLQERRLEMVRKLDSWRKQQAELLSQIETLRRHLAVNEERARQFRRQSAEIEEEVASIDPRREVIMEAIASSEVELERLTGSHERDATRLQEMRQELTLLDQQREVTFQELNEAEETSYRLASDIAAARSELLQIESRCDQARTDCNEHQRLLEERSVIKHRLGGELERSSTDLTRLNEETAEIESHLVARRNELTVSLEAQAELRARLDEAQGKTRQLSDRWELLDRLRRESTGYNPAVRTLLGHRTRVPGIIGPVANLMEVPEELERAVDAALGPLVQAVAVREWKSIEKAASLLQETNDGQATLISVSNLPTWEPLSHTSSSQIIGVASELIRYPVEYKGLFQRLLGDVIVVRDLAAARRVSQQLQGTRARVVTLAGETLSGDGTVTVGLRKIEASLLRQEREWRSLPAQISAAEEQEKQIRSSLQKEKERYETLQEEISDLTKQNDEVRLRIREREAERAKLQKEHAAISGEIEWHESVIGKLENELISNRQHAEELQTQIKSSEEKRAEQSERIAALKQQLSVLSDTGLRQRIAQLETTLAVTQRSRKSQLDLLGSHRANLAQLEKQVQSKRGQTSHLESECAALAVESTTLNANMEQLSQRLESVRQNTGPAEADIEMLELAYSQGTTEERKAREHLRQLESQLSRLSLDEARLQDTLKGLARQIEEELGPVTIPSDLSHQLRLEMGGDSVALPVTSSLPEGLEQEVQNLKAQLKRLSPINPNAPDEHAEALQRYNFLTTQSEDLENAINALHEVIAELDETIEADLQSTFTAVAREFKHYFGQLFRGGTAKLILTDPEDIANSGIDIIARPPGQRSQNLSLLSGGQRSLTATALLFALLKVNPLPFCILDEVDAMLDEANVGRFRDVLQDLAQETQFIVITHNRLTINSAQTIYGASMGEDGTSKIISLKLPEEVEPEKFTDPEEVTEPHARRLPGVA